MTLEQMGFVKVQSEKDRVLYKRERFFGLSYYYIAFDINYKEVDVTNLDTFDMMLLEAIYTKAKELFE